MQRAEWGPTRTGNCGYRKGELVMSPIRPSERARYPKNWRDIRAAIMERAKGRCEWIRADGSVCGAPNGAIVQRYVENLETYEIMAMSPLDHHVARERSLDKWHTPIRVVLTIAHLDHTPENCAPGNLAALCQLHHLRHDTKHHAKNARATRERKSPQKRLLP